MSALKRLAKRAYDALPFKQPLYTLLRAVIRLPEPVYRHLHFKGIFTVKVDERASFRIRHHGHLIENELFWRGLGGWEKTSLELWVRLCRRSRVILDVGANTGVYSLVAKAVAPQAVIAALEPVQRVFDRMRMNFELNGGGIAAIRAAASDRKGVATLYDQGWSDHVLSVSLDPEWNKEDSNLIPVEVPCLTVMDVLDELKQPSLDLIKIDVETYEPTVLRGFIDLIRRDRPTMLVELLNDTVAAQVAELVDGLGYAYYNIDDKAWPPQRTERLSRSAHYNFLICRPEVAAGIGL
jgi:FkbM family methyltransferase